jgi:hypothetical protein
MTERQSFLHIPNRRNPFSKVLFAISSLQQKPLLSQTLFGKKTVIQTKTPYSSKGKIWLRFVLPRNAKKEIFLRS